MDILLAGLRDRRGAAADVFTTRDGRNIYATGSHARRAAAQPPATRDVRTAHFDRQPSDIQAVILHVTTFTSSEPLPPVAADGNIANRHRLDHVIAHFVVRRSGEILYTHDVQYRLNSVSGSRAVDVEFEGDFGHGPRPTAERLSAAAISAGRQLVKALKYQLGVRYVHPHGQVQETAGNPKRDSCPGPDIWVNVGEWAVRHLGLVCDQTVMRNNHGISTAQRNPAYDQRL